MISFNGQYPLKLLFWVWRALILFFLIRFTNWKAEIWLKSGRKIFPTSGKNSHMWKCRPKHTKPLQSSLFQIITRVSAYYRFVNPMGLKPMTSRTGIWRSIQLSYGSIPLYSRMFRTIVYDRQAIRITMQSYKDFIDFSHIGHDRPNIISVF